VVSKNSFDPFFSAKRHNSPGIGASINEVPQVIDRIQRNPLQPLQHLLQFIYAAMAIPDCRYSLIVHNITIPSLYITRMDIQFVPRGEHQIPTRGSKGAAGWDLYAAEDKKLYANYPTLVPTNIDIAIPEGTMLLVLPRSGNSLRRKIIIPNSPGLIDEDYRGHLQVILTWIPPDGEAHPGAHTEIKKGDRIAQAVLIPYVEQSWVQKSELPSTDRGTGGFGSTGA
jgi:dUTP pyrophosphatase